MSENDNDLGRTIEAEAASLTGRVAGPFGPSSDSVRLHGEVNVRGLDRTSLSSISDGRFGRMFRRLAPLAELPLDTLRELADTMREPTAPSGWGGTIEDLDNPGIPAGYTYFGQFIDHDLTFDPTSSLERQNDPDALHNFRTPRFDLDSLYGSGPIDEPFHYFKGSNGMRMLFGPNDRGEEDLPRNSEGVAVIGDPRNDENTIVGQMQLLFLKLHNKFAQQVEADATVPVERKFLETQRLVRWHYQWIVINDLLPRTLGDELFAELYEEKENEPPNIVRPNFRPRKNAFMPVEFSVAGFRFGHSQVRGIYNLSDIVRDRPIFLSGPLQEETQDLRGFRPLPRAWTIDWKQFFAIDGSAPQPSRKLDAKLVPGLFDLPDNGGSLALRNLRRGQAMGLPAGQDVAKYLRVDTILSGADLGAPHPTPLWFYILKESEILADGLHLGPTGGRIVGEVLLGLLELDKQSYFSVDPFWKPTIPDEDGDGRVTMADLIQFAS